MEFTLASIEETYALGALVGRSASAGCVVALNGALGAGKTVFAQGVGKGLSVAETLTSPTFVLANWYHSGRLSLLHADLYRLNSVEEAHAIGLEEALEGDGVGLVEWAERFPEVLPLDRLDLSLSFVPGEPGRRRLVLGATGGRAQAWLTQMRSEIEALVGQSRRG